MRRIMAAAGLTGSVCALVFAPGATAGHAARCNAAHLTGLTVEKARPRARHAGCSLRLRGVKLTMASIQTIARTHVEGGTIVAWVNPLCPHMAAAGPPGGEPKLTPGPSELISGLYLAGGPLLLASAPHCREIVGTPTAGTITVRDLAPPAGDGAVVATETVGQGQLAHLMLAPGTYSVEGVFGEASINGMHGESQPLTVKIPAGDTVRDDVVLPIP
jgi:hypothetical protein